MVRSLWLCFALLSTAALLSVQAVTDDSESLVQEQLNVADAQLDSPIPTVPATPPPGWTKPDPGFTKPGTGKTRRRRVIKVVRRRRRTGGVKPPTAARRRRVVVGIASRVTKLEGWLKQTNANVRNLSSNVDSWVSELKKQDENIQNMHKKLQERIDAIEDRHAKDAKECKDEMAKMKDSMAEMKGECTRSLAEAIEGLAGELNTLREEVEHHHRKDDHKDPTHPPVTTMAPGTLAPMSTTTSTTGFDNDNSISVGQVEACNDIQERRSCFMFNRDKQSFDMGKCTAGERNNEKVLFCDKYPHPDQLACDGKKEGDRCVVNLEHDGEVYEEDGKCDKNMLPKHLPGWSGGPMVEKNWVFVCDY